MSEEPVSDFLHYRTAWGIVWSFTATSGAKIVSLGAMALLARLIAPEAFGLMAFGMLTVGYAEAIGDLGTGAALIYFPSSRKGAADLSFLFNVIAGFAWLGLIWLAAPAVAGFFDNPQATGILRALAWSFPLKALGNTHDALARKSLRFRARLVPEMGMALLKALVAVALAYLGYGVWALVWGQVLGTALWTTLLWVVVDFRPRLRFERGLLGPMLAYGWSVVMVNLVAAVVHHTDAVIVGKMLGAAALGLYHVAFKLPEATITLAVWATSRVLFPVFAQARQGESLLRSSYIEALRYVSLLTVPAAVGLALLADPIVTVFFGEAWRGSVPILRALALAAGVRSLSTCAGDALKAMGRPGLLALLGVARALVLIPLLAVAAREGAASVAVALAAVTALATCIQLAVVCRLLDIRLLETARVLKSSLAATLPLGVFLLIFQQWLPMNATATCTAIAIGGAIYLTSVRFSSPNLLARVLESLSGRRCAVRVSGGEGAVTVSNP